MSGRDEDEITDALREIAEYARKSDRLAIGDWDDAVFQATRAQAHASNILVKLTGRLEKLTWALVSVTVILGVLTSVLVFKELGLVLKGP